MKSWEEFEARLRRENPKLFASKKIAMTPQALLATCLAAWKAGARAGRENAELSKSLFERVFG